MFLPPDVMIRSFFRSVILRKPVGVELADVAGVHPAVGVDRLGRPLLVAVVAGHHQRAADQHLAVVGDPQLHPGNARPTAPLRESPGTAMVAALQSSVIPQPSTIGSAEGAGRTR